MSSERAEITQRVLAAAHAAGSRVNASELAEATGIDPHEVKEAIKLLLYRKCLTRALRGEYEAVPGATFEPRRVRPSPRYDASALMEVMLPLTLKDVVTRINASSTRPRAAPVEDDD